MTQSIEKGMPLAFKVSEEGTRSSLTRGQDGQSLMKVEARQLTGHQKEALVTEGSPGHAWRLTSDEGAALKGSDLAPFPLGFFNAGLQGDLIERIDQVFSAQRSGPITVETELVNAYSLTGSFALGTGQGHAEPSTIKIQIESGAPHADAARMVERVLQQSPAMDLLRTPIENTFALYINGRRKTVEGISRSESADAVDPFLRHRGAPQPLRPEPTDLILKSTISEGDYAFPGPVGTPPRILRTVQGRGHLQPGREQAALESWLELPGASHFHFKTSVSADTHAPSGLALISAGVAFCYMTQLARYIESMKMAVCGVRLVQYTPYAIDGGRGRSLPIDTHLFLNGEAPEETHLQLLRIAARTCYLHATMAAHLEPQVVVFHNGVKIL